MTWSFIIDANLPPALATAIVDLGHSAEHVATMASIDTADELIWKLALERQAVVVTRDGDFAAMSAMKLQGPVIIWLRMGNVRKGALLARIAQVWPELIAALDAGERIVEVR